MPEYLTPGVYFELRDTVPPVRGIRTDIAGFVGLAERGPVDKAVRITSWRHFQALFGDFVHYGFLAYAVKGFFDNGGRTCFVVRIASPAAAPATLMLKNAGNANVIRVSASSPGTWGRRVAVVLVATTPKTFTLRVLHGNDMELYSDLSVDPKSARYFVTMINAGDEYTAASRWITVEVATPVQPDLIPDAGKSGLTNGRAMLAGGLDGLATLAPADFLGVMDVPAAQRRGLAALALVDEVSIVAMPDIQIRPTPTLVAPPPTPPPPRDPCVYPPEPPEPPAPPAPAPEQPPLFTSDVVLYLQRAMVEHCESMADRFAILDAPLVGTTTRSMTITEITAARSNYNSDRGYAALYYPWIKVVDPIASAGAVVREVPPSGHVAGLYARTDLAVGVHKAPANGALEWAEDVTVMVNDAEQGILNPIGVNCIRPFPGRGIRVFGARTISSNADWRYVNVRRLMMMIEEAVDESSQWAVFEPHNPVLRQGLIMSVSSFLNTLWRNGQLAGAKATEAYFVRCDDTNNPQSSVDQGRIIVDVGVAPATPAEFIIFRIGRTAQELEIVER